MALPPSRRPRVRATPPHSSSSSTSRDRSPEPIPAVGDEHDPARQRARVELGQPRELIGVVAHRVPDRHHRTSAVHPASEGLSGSPPASTTLSRTSRSSVARRFVTHGASDARAAPERQLTGCPRPARPRGRRCASAFAGDAVVWANTRETLALDEARKHEPIAGRRLLRQARAGVIRSRDGLLPVAAAGVCSPSLEPLAYTCRGSGGRGRQPLPSVTGCGLRTRIG
jgi:hypothetical protein